MGITREQFRKEADIAAGRIWGARTYKWRLAWHLAPQIAVAVAVALAGFAVWKLWHFAEGLRTAPQTAATADPHAVPLWVWLAGAVLAVVTAVAFRPGRIDRLGVLAAKLLLIPAAWLLLAGFVASRILG